MKTSFSEQVETLVSTCSLFVCRVGSHLYGLNTPRSDEDFQIITSLADLQAKQKDPGTLTLPARSTQHLRFSTFEHLIWSLIDTERWAWEPWLEGAEWGIWKNGNWTPDSKYQSYQTQLRTLLPQLVSDLESYNTFKRYEERYLPEALADFPFSQRVDYAQDFARFGWHCKVGYYLMIELQFRLALTHKELQVKFTASEASWMKALKAGEISKREWHLRYQAIRSLYAQTIDHPHIVLRDAITDWDVFDQIIKKFEQERPPRLGAA